jgi:hypothetical protein
MTITEIQDLLSEYEARDWDSASEPYNIWQDVILSLPDYDEAATDRIDKGTNDRFVALDTVFYYSQADSKWLTETFSQVWT